MAATALDRIAAANMPTDERAEELYEFLNDMIRSEQESSRTSPSADDLAAHLDCFQTYPDEEYRQAETAASDRLWDLGLLVEKLGVLQEPAATKTRKLTSLMRALLQASLGIERAKRVQAIEAIMQMEALVVECGIRPWTPVLKPWLEHWHRYGAVLVPANHHPRPLLPHSLAVGYLPDLTVTTLKLSPTQSILPGFGDAEIPMSLPVQLQDLSGLKGGKGAATLAQRAVVECLLLCPQASWDHPARMRMPVRQFLEGLYPNKGWQHGAKLVRMLRKLQDDVYTFRVSTSQGELRPVAIDWVPIRNEKIDLNECLEFRVRLPPGGTNLGAPVDREKLRWAGLRTAPGYRAYLNIIYTWQIPGKTVIPGKGRSRVHRWLNARQVNDPGCYPTFSQKQLETLAFPQQAMTGRRNTNRPSDTAEALAKLAVLGAVRILGADGKSFRILGADGKTTAEMRKPLKLLPPPDFRKRVRNNANDPQTT